MGLISAEDFARGRCFQEVAVQNEELRNAAPPPSRGSVSKRFCSPTLSGRKDHSVPKREEEQTCRPRHDPLAPGMLEFFLGRFDFLNILCMHNLTRCLLIFYRCAGDASSLRQSPVVEQQVWAPGGRCCCGPVPDQSAASTPEGWPSLSLRVCHGLEVTVLVPVLFEAITASVGMPNKTNKSMDLMVCVRTSELRVAMGPSWRTRWVWGRPSRAWHSPGRCSNKDRMEGEPSLSASWWSHQAAWCTTGRQSSTSGWAARGSASSVWIRCGEEGGGFFLLDLQGAARNLYEQSFFIFKFSCRKAI